METLPHNADAEQGLLAAILADPPAALSALRESHPNALEYHFNFQHRAIHRSAVEIVGSGQVCESASLFAALDADPEMRAYVSGLISQSVSAGLSGHYADMLRPLYVRRQQIELAARLDRAARDGDDAAVLEARTALAEVDSPRKPDSLPEILDASELVASDLPRPAELIAGLLHRGSKLVLGGSSKSFKTWSLLDLAISVSHGEPFWSMKVSKGRALYLNLEVQPEFFAGRVHEVASGKNLRLQSGLLDVWNLRGHAADFRTLLPKIRQRIAERGYVLIVLDPIYKLLGDADENSAGDMAELMNAVERLARDTGAAVAFGAHFAKGNASAKESIDRISGSGVFARDPDSILTLTKHEEADAFTVDATLRNFKPLAPFVVRWQFPLMRRDSDLDPSKLKKVGGAPKKHVAEVLVKHLKKPLTTERWKDCVCTEEGMARSTFFALKKELETEGKIRQDEGGKWWIVREVRNGPKTSSRTAPSDKSDLPLGNRTSDYGDSEQGEESENL